MFREKKRERGRERGRERKKKGDNVGVISDMSGRNVRTPQSIRSP